ncbi:MAG: hypothetical protein ACOY94_06220 [Bacillota bacterium]
MKSLNQTQELWTNLSVKEVENSNYQSACCLNARIIVTKQPKKEQ